jgi:hypothetical protein
LFSALKRTGLEEATDRIETLLGLNLPPQAENAPEGEDATKDDEQA